MNFGHVVRVQRLEEVVSNEGCVLECASKIIKVNRFRAPALATEVNFKPPKPFHCACHDK